jgi:hypothetical protein
MASIFCNRAPGQAWQQNHPETITDALFDTVKAKLGTSHGSNPTRWGLSIFLSYLDGPPDALSETLSRLCAQSARTQVPILIVLDGPNWWGYRKDLWQDPQNVEWTGWGSQHVVQIAWRNWGRQIRVLPPPNLASPAFRRASREAYDDYANGGSEQKKNRLVFQIGNVTLGLLLSISISSLLSLNLPIISPCEIYKGEKNLRIVRA